jgi:hypothetical protein
LAQGLYCECQSCYKFVGRPSWIRRRVQLWRDLKECRVNCSHSETCWRDVPFSSVDERLIRRLWRVGKNKHVKGFSKWGYVFAGYGKTLAKNASETFFKTVGAFPNCCERCFIDFLKEFSRINLRQVLEGDELWRMMFLDLKVLGGFDTVYNRDDPFEAYEKDFCTESDQVLSEEMKWWIDNTINKIEFVPVGYTFEEFVSFRDAWALPGASVQGTRKKVMFKRGDERNLFL